MALENSRIDQLNLGTPAVGDFFIYRDMVNGLTKKTSVDPFITADANDLEWNSTVAAAGGYDEDEVVTYGGKFYQSTEDNNETVPGVDETWEQINKSSNWAYWEEGVYTEEKVIVVSEHRAAGNPDFYFLTVPSPYVSADIATEELDGVWLRMFDNYWPLEGGKTLVDDVSMSALAKDISFLFSSGTFSSSHGGNRNLLFELNPEDGGFGDGGITILAHDPGTGKGTRILMDDVFLSVGNDSTNNFPGIVYDEDYSVDFNDRSLVDKGYVDNLVATGGVWPASGIGTLTGLVQMVDTTSNDAGLVIQGVSTTSEHVVSLVVSMIQDGVSNAASVGFSAGNTLYTSNMQFSVADSGGPLAEWQIQNQTSSGISYIRIGSDMRAQMVPSGLDSTWAEMNSGYPGSGDEDHHYIRLYGADAPEIAVFGENTNIGIRRHQTGSLFDMAMLLQSNAAVLWTHDNTDFDAFVTVFIDEVFIHADDSGSGTTGAVRVTTTDVILDPDPTGFLNINIPASVDAALVSTHSMVVKIEGTQYKIPLILV